MSYCFSSRRRQTSSALVTGVQTCALPICLCGKNPVVVRDNPDTWGHVGNRVYAAAIREAKLIVEEGLTDQEGVDQILMDGWGWPAGPFGMTRGPRDGWTSKR